jgi:hypothetical protein
MRSPLLIFLLLLLLMHSSSAQKVGQARIDSLLTAMHSVHKDSNLVKPAG